MKFSEYIYIRPDMVELKNNFEKCIEKINNAKDAKEAIDSFYEINKYRRNYSTQETLCSIRYSINTLDKFYEEEQNFFDNNSPIYQELETKLAYVLGNIKYKKEMSEAFGDLLFKLAEVQLKIFNPSIIDDLVEENLLRTKYSKLKASAKIDFDGEIKNLSQMRSYMSNPSREIRKQAEEKTSLFYKDNSKEFDQIYDSLVKVRTIIAKKLGFKNFVELGYLRLCRIDYDSKMVANYRKQVYEDLVPLVCKLQNQRAKRLNIKDIKSYDLDIAFLSGNPTPKGSKDFLVECAKKMYSELSKETKEFFDYMVENELLDLEAKPGKNSGGYCTFISNYKSPFIFSNFNGTCADVEVLTHEAGHAFQVYTVRNFEILEYMWPTYEACEIHSMSMEFLTWPWMELFFQEDTKKFKYNHLAESIMFIPYGVLIDEFQHYIYENPDISCEERNKYFREIEKKYMPYKVYDDEFLNTGTFWYRQSHIFETPFYYIDYTLAQVCAHQFFLKSLKDRKTTWEDYYNLCKCGGSKSFLDLLKVAKLDNPFIDGTIKKVTKDLNIILDSFDSDNIK